MLSWAYWPHPCGSYHVECGKAHAVLLWPELHISLAWLSSLCMGCHVQGAHRISVCIEFFRWLHAIDTRIPLSVYTK